MISCTAKTAIRYSLLWCCMLWVTVYVSNAWSENHTPQPAPKTGDLFTFQTVTDRAAELAKEPFQDPLGRVPEFLLNLSYDQWRDIRYKPESSLWRKEKLPFEIQFFHPGFYYNIPVAMHAVTGRNVEKVAFSPELFDYGSNVFQQSIPSDLGFAGLRVHYNINTAAYKDEFVVFLGATYLRAVARAQQYGLSARGLAIDTGLPAGEEFPFFREFWLKKPSAGDTRLTVYALLDSPSLTGAYCYTIHPGKETVLDVDSVLFFRKGVKKLGIAPLTSMFFYGENTNIKPVDGFRPEVHDSDGLLIALQNGEWLWRPLVNPAALLINTFKAPNPTGFGLVQRDLAFDHYQDLEARYDLRPSTWITPKGEWGNGACELIQIPTDSEIHDNIVAFWRPAVNPQAQQSAQYSYTMQWHVPGKRQPPAGRSVATRTSKGTLPNAREFIIDFEGGDLGLLGTDDIVEATVTVSQGGRLATQQVFKNTVTGGWRLVFQVVPEDESTLVEKVLPDKKPLIELRAFLKRGKHILTETWSYGTRL